MEWTRIVRSGPPRVRGVNSQYPGLLDVEIDLTRTPPPEWTQGFIHPSGVGISLSMHPPEISGSRVQIRPPDGELEKYVAHVDERIEAANTYFEQRVLPALNAAEAQAQQRKATEQSRIADATRQADKL